MNYTGPSSHRFSRRDSIRMLGLAGLGAMLGSASGTGAQDVPTAMDEGLQGAGFYRRKLGQLELLLVSDGGFPMDPAGLFGDVSADAMAAAKEAAFITTPAVPGHVNCLLVKDGTNLILIDTGCGALFGPTTGFLKRNLDRAGISPEMVTHVVLTHAHPDHIGGLVRSDGELAFPGAQVVMNRAEYDAWTAASPSFPKTKVPAEMIASMVEGAKKSLGVARPKLELAKPDDRVGTSITMIDAPGHTPGHVALLIESGGESALYLTDAVHVPSLQLANPDWHILFDADPEEAASTRRTLLDSASRERRLVAGAHLPFPGFGHVVSAEGGYRFVPSVWEW